jgi:hypothetical protein
MAAETRKPQARPPIPNPTRIDTESPPSGPARYKPGRPVNSRSARSQRGTGAPASAVPKATAKVTKAMTDSGAATAKAVIANRRLSAFSSSLRVLLPQ